MRLDQLTSLVTESDSKIVLLVMDGLGGLPLTADGLTELETAKTPNMDRLAKEGVLGQITPLNPGLTLDPVLPISDFSVLIRSNMRLAGECLSRLVWVSRYLRGMWLPVAIFAL